MFLLLPDFVWKLEDKENFATLFSANFCFRKRKLRVEAPPFPYLSHKIL